MDREDIEMLFRCLIQFARHLARKYSFTIKQYAPETSRGVEQSEARQPHKLEDAGSNPVAAITTE